MLIYTVEENGKKQTFEGFTRVTKLRGDCDLALVQVQGECDIWWVESPLGLAELERFYRMTGEEVEIVVFRK